MNSEPEPQDFPEKARLDHLADAYFDGGLSAAERAELEALLLVSSRNRQHFLDRADEHGLLRESALRKASGPMMEEDGAPARRPESWRPLALAAALLVLGSVGAGVWFLRAPREVRPVVAAPARAEEIEEVALLAQVAGVAWESATLREGAAVRPGEIAIRSGSITLEFYSGASLNVTGPARLDLLSSEKVAVLSGQITGHVPPPARGFTLLHDGYRLVDQGTEFGFHVKAPGEFEVHVFDGQVDLFTESGADAGVRPILQGAAVAVHAGRREDLAADRGAFTDTAVLRDAAERESSQAFGEWYAEREALRIDPDLVVHYDFQELSVPERRLENRAPGGDADSDGYVIGCEALTGRWKEKRALGFTRPSDRVRLRLHGLTPSLTIYASLRVDSLQHVHNALFSMAPNRKGEVHWKFDQEGRLLLGLRAQEEVGFEGWERLVSPVIVGPEDFGRWMSIATVIDGPGRMMRHYLDGREIASAPIMRPTDVLLDCANLGNFDAEAQRLGPPGERCSVNGRIDDFLIFSRALTVDEIQGLR